MPSIPAGKPIKGEGIPTNLHNSSICDNQVYLIGSTRGRAGIRGEIDSLRAQSGADDDMRTPRAGETLREFYRLGCHPIPWGG